MKCKKELVATDAGSVDQVVAAIKSFEDSVQASLSESYANLESGAFKDLRRALPVFRTRIKWETISGCKSCHLKCRQD